MKRIWLDRPLKDIVVIAVGHRSALTLTSVGLLASYAVIISNLGPLIAPIATHLRVSLVTAGLFPVTWSLCYIPGTIVSGALLDRHGARPVLSGAGGLVLGCLVLLSFGLTFPQRVPVWLLLMLIGIAGFGGGGIDAGANGLVSTLYSKGRAGILLLCSLVFPVGSTLITLLDAGLLWLFPTDPRILLVFPIGMTACSLLAFLAVSRKSMPVQPGEIRKQRARTLGAFSALLWKIAPVMGILLLAHGVGACLITWTPVYLQQTFALSSASATAVTSLILSSTIVYRLLMARYITRFRTEWVMLFSLVIMFIGALLLLWQQFLVGAIALALVALGSEAIVTLGLAIGAERVESEQGLVSGLLLCCMGVGISTWNGFFDVVFNEVGQQWAVGICAAGAGLAVLIGMLLVPHKRPGPEIAELRAESNCPISKLGQTAAKFWVKPRLCWLFSVSVPKSLTHARNKRQKKALKGFISSEYTSSSARQTSAMK